MKELYTFDWFWQKFHESNKIRKIDKQRCLKLWDSCIIPERKKEAIKSIDRIYHANVYEYLKFYLKQ